MPFSPAMWPMRERFLRGAKPGYVYSRPTYPNVPPSREVYLPTYGDRDVVSAWGPKVRVRPATGLGMSINIKDAFRQNATVLALAGSTVLLAGIALIAVMTKKKTPKKANRRRNGLLAGRRLGEVMLHWHSSGSDPIYAAGSFLFAGHKPNRGAVEGALANIRQDIARFPHIKVRAGWTLEDLHQLQAIERGLLALLRRKGAVAECDLAGRPL